MPNSPPDWPPQKGSATPPGPDPKAVSERACETISKPGGFQNHPNDPTNPNEVIERSRRTLRPNPLPEPPTRPEKIKPAG
jgi:hypothetical protein